MLETRLLINKIACLFFGHLIGDYIFQSDYIATTKGTNWWHLIVHSILYGLPFLLVFGFVWQLPIVIVSHFMVDALKARYKMISYVTDQILHLITLLLYLV